MYWRIVLFIILCFSSLYSFESFQILDKHPSIVVLKPLSYTTGPLSPLEAERAFQQSHFQTFPTKAKSFGFSEEPIWVGIELQNGCIHNPFMSLQNLSLEHVEYYIFQKGILIQQGKTGASVPIAKRPIQTFDLRIPLIETTEPTLYLMKISSHRPLVFPIAIGTDGALQLFILPEIITIAIFTGIFLALFLYNSILFVVTREKDYLLYSLYIFFLFALMLSIREYFAPFLQIEFYLQNIIKFVSLQGSTLFMLLFTLSFLNIKTRYPNLYKRILLLSVVYLLLIFAISLGIIGQHVGIITIMILAILTSSFLGIFSHVHGNAFAKYYLIASSGFSISMLIAIATVQGIIPYTYLTYNATIFGAIWQIILFSLALGYKIKLLYREHTKAMTHIQTQNKMLFLQSRYTSVGELIRNITHQWKEPLGEIGSIQTNLKSTLVFQGSVSNEKLLNSINLSHKIISHLAETIDTFYRFFRAKTTDNQEFDITKEIDNLQRMVKYTFDCEHIELTCKYSEQPIILSGHPNEFAHAILNIILNAKDILIKRHIQNPTVSINVSTTPTEIIIYIEDNGGGILQEPISKIFDAGISSNEENIGIGLYIAKTIVEQKMQGHLTVKNSDFGAIFTIVLPHTLCESESSHILPSFMNMEESAITRISRLEKDIARRIEVEKNLQQWAHIFGESHWGIAICNATTNTFDLINPEFARMHGFSVEELLHQPITDVFTPEQREKIPEILEIVHNEGHFSFEAEHLRKDGSTFPVDIDMIAVTSDDGKILYRIANVRDITLYKQTHEQMLLKRFALNHIQDAVFMVDENAHFHYVNQGACEALGYSYEEFEQMNIGDIDPDWPQEKWTEYWNILKEAGSMTMELRHRRKDGTIFPVEVSANYIAFGEKAYNMGIARNITERKEAEGNLRLKEFALDTINEAVYLIDENSMFHYVNDGTCKALGYTKEELLTMGVVDIDPNCTVAWWKTHWEEIKERKTFLLETTHQKKDGTILPVEISINFFEFNDIHYNLAIARDISERLLLEERKEDARMRLFFEKQLIGMAISSPEKNWLKVNDKLCTMFGYSQEELTHKTWSELTYPEDLEPDVKQFERVLRGEIEGFSIQKRFIRKDGTILYTNLSTMCIRRADHSAEYFLTLVEDITEQKRAHTALVAKEQELRALADSSPGMMGSFYLRPDGSFCMPYVSPNIFDLFGLHPQDVANDATPLLALNHPDDATRIKESIAQSAHTMDVWHEEYRINHPKKGERWMESNTKPELHPNGGIVWYGYVHDITERKYAEEALSAKEEEFRAITENSPDIIVRFDAQCRRCYINPKAEELFGIDKSLLMEKTFAETTPVVDKDLFEKNLQNVILTKEEISFETAYMSASGKKNWAHMRMVPEFATNGNISSVLSIGRDITERKKIEEKLKRSETSLNKAQSIAKIGSWELDIASDTLTWSDETYRIFELNPEQTTELHKAFYEIVHPDDREMVSRLYVESVKAKLPYEMPHRIVMRDGRIKHVLETCETQYDQEGNPVLSIGTVQDITDRTQMELSLQESNERYLQILDHSTDVIYLIEVTPEGRFVYVDVNAAYEEVTGIPRDVVMGLRVEEIEDETFRAILIDKFTTCLNAGETTNYIADYPFPAGIRTFHSVLSPIRDENGRIVRIVGAARDITEQRQNEETIRELNMTLETKVNKRTQQLQHALEFSEGVINALPDLLFEIDINGNYLNVWAHNEELLARHQELLLGHNVYDVLSHEAADTVMEALREANIKGVSFGHTIKIDLPQGAMYFEESVSKKMSSDTFLVLSHDVTKQKQAVEALAKSEEAFRAIVENSPDVIARYNLEYRRIYANPMMQYLLNKPLDELLGEKPSEHTLLPSSIDFEKLLAQVISEKQETTLETLFYAPDGKEHWGDIRIIPEFNAQNEVISVLMKGRDISKIKEHQKKLELLKMAINSTDDAMYIINDSSIIEFANTKACEMLGYGKEILIGMHIGDLDAHLTQEDILNIANDVALGKSIEFETKHKMSSGDTLDVYVKLTYFQFEATYFGICFVKQTQKGSIVYE